MSKLTNNLSHSNVLLLKAKNKQEMFYNELLLSNPDFFHGSYDRKAQTPGKKGNNKDNRHQLKSPMENNTMARKPPTQAKNKQGNDIHQEMVINCLMNKKRKPLGQKGTLSKNHGMKIKSPSNYNTNRHERPLSNNSTLRRDNSKEFTRAKMSTNTPMNSILSNTMKIKDKSNRSQNINKSSNTTLNNSKNKSENNYLFHSKQNSYSNLKDNENSLLSNNMIKNSSKEEEVIEKKEFKDLNTSPLLKVKLII